MTIAPKARTQGMRTSVGNIIRMFAGFMRWLTELPAAIRTWPGRFAEWVVDSFWNFVDWIVELPQRIHDFLVALFFAFRDLFLAIVRRTVALGKGLFAFLMGLLTSPSKFLQMKLDPDPASIPPHRLTISQRGRRVAVFSRQLASMVHGGVPMLQSLDVLGDQADDARLGYVSRDIAGKLSQGFSFSKAVSLYPRIFPPVFAHLLKAGESTGRIVQVIDRLADLLEKEENLLKRVKGALSYPLFVLGLTFVLTLGLFSTVLPGFADFYDDFDVPLPAITAFLMMITAWVQSVWFWVILVSVLVLTYYLLKTSWANVERRLIMYQILLLIPLVGPIMRYSSLARFCWILELTQDAGLDLVRAVNLGCLASGSAVMEADYKRLSKGMTEGEHLSELMVSRPDIYPHLLHQMVMMGEETSQTSQGFGRAGAWFEQEVQARVESFQVALEPILMGLISMVVGTIVLAVFLPLYGLLDKLGV
jgi:type IV pilus assembly protein PilC